MCKIVSIPTADHRLKSLARWVNRQQGKAIIRIDGKKAAVLVTYAEYEEIEKLRSQNLQLKLLQQLEMVRRRIKTRAA